MRQCHSRQVRRTRSTTHHSLVGLIWCVVLVVLQSCGSPAVDAVGEPSSFYPVQPGDFWVYQISRTTYSPVAAPTRETYLLQHRISDTYSQGGQTYFVVDESTRQTVQQDWTLVSLSAVCPGPSALLSIENNVPLVRLAFPVSDQQRWNLNQYTTKPDTLLHYTAIDQPYKLGSREVKRTVTVVGANDSTLVGQHTYRRVYATGVGLVYREDASLAFCQSTAACVGRAIIESGTRQEWTLIGSSRLP